MAAEIKIVGYEAQSRLMFKSVPHSQANVLIEMVFVAMWSASLPAERVERIACAMANLQSVDLKPALSELVRRKVLRSRMIAGVRHYEVNY